MGIVKLNSYLFVQLFNVISCRLVLLHNIGKRSRTEEILLLEAENLALSCIVIRIKHSRNILSLYLFYACVYIVLCIELEKIECIHRLSLPQTERAYVFCAVCDNRHIVRHCNNCLICKVYNYLVAFVSSAPRVAVLSPVVSLFFLKSVNYRLLEKSVLITYSISVKR